MEVRPSWTPGGDSFVFYAFDPYSNGVPNGTDLANYTQPDLDAVAQRLNSRPCKTLGSATPADRLPNTLLH